MTSEELNQLPLSRFEGRIHKVRNRKEWDKVAHLLPEEGVVGFDTESRPSFRKGQWYPPTLIQFATLTDAILVQIGQMEEPGEVLNPVLENPHLWKVGVALRDDIRFMLRVFAFEPAGFVEIDPMAKKAGLPYTGLRKLAGKLLGERLSKGAQVSDWSRARLSESQTHYAAADAWVSLRLYLILREEYDIDAEMLSGDFPTEEKERKPRRRRRRRTPRSGPKDSGGEATSE